MALLRFPQIGQDPRVVRSFLGAAAFLVLWAGALYVLATRGGRQLSIQAAIRRPHWVQMFAQGSILVYWGWFVRPVYDFAPFILAQILFAFAVDALVQWSRRDAYGMGFGPVPVIFSINLFLWFKPEWFYLQFAMVALGFIAKEMIRWQKDGKSAHIFNPSSFPLAIASVLLIATGSTDITEGVAIAATQYNPPHIFLVIFLASLPGQLLFGVATMTWAAVVSAYAFGLLYFAATGVYFFYDSYIPIAVFLGMHLLFTDPSTSPKTQPGRVIFGFLYGAGVIVLFALLEGMAVPSFYDKLLPVPVLNLSVRAIDRLATRGFFRYLEPAKLLAFVPFRETRHATASLWIVTFVGMSAAGGVGDHHRGQYLPFWDQACEADRRGGCSYLSTMQSVYCARGSGWACNELGINLATNLGQRDRALREFERGCSIGFRPACGNALALGAGSGTLAEAPPPIEDFPIVIRGSKGEVTERDPVALYALACERGWPDTCAGPPVTAAGSAP